jgi:hypothetical protein
MAKARDLEVYSSRGKGSCEGLGKGDMPALTSPEPAQDLALISVSSSWCYFASPEAGLQRHFSLHDGTGRPRQECLCKLMTVSVPTCKLAQRWL